MRGTESSKSWLYIFASLGKASPQSATHWRPSSMRLTLAQTPNMVSNPGQIFPQACLNLSSHCPLTSWPWVTSILQTHQYSNGSWLSQVFLQCLPLAVCRTVLSRVPADVNHVEQALGYDTLCLRGERAMVTINTHAPYPCISRWHLPLFCLPKITLDSSMWGRKWDPRIETTRFPR